MHSVLVRNSVRISLNDEKGIDLSAKLFKFLQYKDVRDQLKTFYFTHDNMIAKEQRPKMQRVSMTGDQLQLWEQFLQQQQPAQ